MGILSVLLLLVPGIAAGITLVAAAVAVYVLSSCLTAKYKGGKCVCGASC